MPTTTIGLIVFVVLLAPGLVFSAYRAVHTPVQKPTALREVGGITLRSVIWDVVALAAFGVVRVIFPHDTPDVGRLVRGDTAYIRGDAAYLFWWAVGTLAFACVAAIAGAGVAEKRGDKWPMTWFLPRGGVSPNPAWWILFKERNPGAAIPYAGVVLEDDTYLGGEVLSFSPDSDETPDREMTLGAPIAYRGAGDHELTALDVDAITISARRIRYLTVSYVDSAGTLVPADVDQE